MPTKPRTTRRRAAETPARLRARLTQIIARLEQAYPDAICALHHHNPLELLVATILSAQSTDARVNMVTPALFAKYRTAQDYAAADPRVFEQEIHSTGFFRNKKKSILGMAHALVERHGGAVPATMEELVDLPGVGRPPAGALAPLGRGGARAGAGRGQTDPAGHRRRVVPLVPRDGRRVVRGSRSGRALEPRFCVRQGRSRRAARRGLPLPARGAGAHRTGRLAAHGVPHARGGGVLRRDVLSARGQSFRAPRLHFRP